MSIGQKWESLFREAADLRCSEQVMIGELDCQLFWGWRDFITRLGKYENVYRISRQYLQEGKCGH